jgi:rod shape determining protein RodA
LILLTDSKFFTATANLFYFIGMLLLLLVFPFHTEVKGTNSIIRFANFQLQPAELCKVFVNLALAKYLSRIDTDFTKLRSQLIATALVVFPAIITVLHSETGLALGLFFLLSCDVSRRVTQCSSHSRIFTCGIGLWQRCCLIPMCWQ